MRLQLGETDLAADLGLAPSDDELELLPHRGAIVLACAANGLEQPVGSVSREIEDLALLEASTLRLRRLGFFGRAVVHPRQLEVVHRAFTPDTQDLAAAASARRPLRGST